MLVQSVSNRNFHALVGDGGGVRRKRTDIGFLAKVMLKARAGFYSN